MLSYAEGAWRKGLSQFERAESIVAADGRGVAWVRAPIRTLCLPCLQHMAHVDELRQRAMAFTSEARERGDRALETTIGSLSLPFCALVAGDAETALRTQEESLTRWSREGYSSQETHQAYVRPWIHLYNGDAEAAWRFIAGEWPKLKSHNFLRVATFSEMLWWSRGQAALAYSRVAADPRPLVQDAARCARQLEKKVSSFGPALGGLIRAWLAMRNGWTAEGARLLESAAATLEANDMILYAAAARWRLGQIQGGSEGDARMAEASAAMTALGVADCARFADAFAPAVGRR